MELTGCCLMVLSLLQEAGSSTPGAGVSGTSALGLYNLPGAASDSCCLALGSSVAVQAPSLLGALVFPSSLPTHTRNNCPVGLQGHVMLWLCVCR